MSGLYNAYSGTVFQARHLRPSQVMLLLRGVCKGEPTAGLARELGLPRSTVHGLRQQLQRNAQAMQPSTPLPDEVTVGTVGRTSGQVRLRVVKRTDGATLKRHVERFTHPGTRVCTDEWRGYNNLARPHATVAHGRHKWARDDDGDGVREVHTNTVEGMWTGVRNFLRPFRGVHKRYLCQYVAMCEFNINHKRVSPEFISALVAKHSF